MQILLNNTIWFERRSTFYRLEQISCFRSHRLVSRLSQRIFIYLLIYNTQAVQDQYRLLFIGLKMSQKTNSSLDDTIPLDRNAPGFKLSETNQTFYGSEFSISTSDQSKDSSVKIVYEVINLEGSKSDERNDRMVNLRFGKWDVSIRGISQDHRISRNSF